jgi:hypothetical protein
MSKYSDISKRVGWNGFTTIPTVSFATLLRNKVVNEHCEHSFEQVLRIYRFAPTSNTDDGYKAMCIIYDAHTKGTEIFKTYPV